MEERAYIRVYISIRLCILFWGANRNEKYYNYLMDLQKKFSVMGVFFDEGVGPNVSTFKDDITSF